jgi:hypothetical protein
MAAQQRTTFAVPAGASNYAPESLYGNKDNAALKTPAYQAQIIVETGVATATADLQVLRPDGTPATDAHWVTYKSFTAAVAGASDVYDVAGLPVRLKLKSGGTSGSAVVSLVVL